MKILFFCIVLSTILLGYNQAHIDKLLKKETCQECDFSDTNLSHLDFSAVEVQDSNFKGSNLKNSNFFMANLSGCDFSEANLEGAIFWKANLSFSNLSRVKASYANFKGANFESATFKDSNLSQSISWKADFSDAEIEQSDFSNSELGGAKFYDNNLIGSDLTGAILWKTEFKNSILSQEQCKVAKKEEALFFENVICKNKYQLNKKVEFAGALKNAMKKGDLTPKIKLSSLKNKENLYALGAIGYLKGEVQIFDSYPMNTFVNEDNKIEFDHTYDKDASLLVYAQVKEWVEYKIPNSIILRDQFEEYIEDVADKHGLDFEKPFVFLVEGKIKSNSWHVISWDANDKVHSHKKHVQSGISDTMRDTEVIMLGFFSMYHSGIFTHHTTSMHIHFMTKDKKISGHSDDMLLGKDMILKLPK